MLRTRVRAGVLAGFMMSLAFAGILTVVERGDSLIGALRPEFDRPAPTTLRYPARQFASQRRGEPAYGDPGILIPRGTILSAEEPDHAFAVTHAVRGPSKARLSATFVVNFTLFLLTSTYLRRFGPSRTRLLRSQVGLFSIMVLAILVAKGMLLFSALPEYWMPVTCVSLWCAIPFGRRTAMFINVMLAFMASALLMFDLPLLTVLMTSGLTATVLFSNKRQPWRMLKSAGAGAIVASIVYIAILTGFHGVFDVAHDLTLGLSSKLIACVGGSLLAGVLAIALRGLAQRALGTVPRERLIDLTDLEQPLLQKMAAEAPGSWEHSRSMANLAEAAASAIGADTLLTRVGAYYHDLGKTIQPKYFVENLLAGEHSPHDDLDPDVSADAIMAHVVQGAKILREAGIPEAVVEFCYTHHGTQTIEFFRHKCHEQGNPKHLSDDFFRYPGMKPLTKETAILMLVDSIEAASRTIQPPERAKFEEMIQRVIFTKLRAGQLDESGLTLEDVRTLTVKMADVLVNMFHNRVKYPWQDDHPKTR